MGNSSVHSNMKYTFNTVDEIPEGYSPPGLAELTRKVKDISLYVIQKFDPVDLKTCQNCMKSPKKIQESEKIIDDLASYTPDQPAFSEKTYQFRMEGMPEIWISSTKNSDHTISYWFQYPILPFHVQAAFLSCMNMPITPSNMSGIAKLYPAVFNQLLHITKNEIAKCEQIEPLYVDLAIKSLLSRGYKPLKKRIEINE